MKFSGKDTCFIFIGCYFFIFLINIQFVYAQSGTSIRLRNFSLKNGLPGNTIRTIYQDNEGFIWMGIESFGLCRFNGIQYDIYVKLSDDPSSISSDFVEVIAEDKDCILWIGTDFGLNYFNDKTSDFKSFKLFPNTLGPKYKSLYTIWLESLLVLLQKVFIPKVGMK